MPLQPHFFPTPSVWRAWLQKHDAGAGERWIGFYKRGSGRPSITWPEAVDGALCFGWIDGIRKSIDDVSYKIRFTPRKPRSIWSAINVRRATELSALGLMHTAGLAVPLKSGMEIAPRSTPTSREKPLSFQQRMRKSFAAIRLPGNSSATSRPGIKKSAAGGSSARKKKKPDASAWPR